MFSKQSWLGVLKSASWMLIMIALPSFAEIVTDGSLGAKVELSGKDFQITPELGQQLGGNLFHSFQSFNLNSDESATFSGADSVQNVISRVTGGSPSHLDGLIRSTLPNADLYFLNPYGIMFGPNAKLDLQGGFHVSTADYLKLQDGGRFEARNPSNSLLSVAPVTAFGFLTESPAAITTQDSRLTVRNGKTLSLIGGEITLTGSEPPIYNDNNGALNLQSRSWLLAESGWLRLASFAAIGEVDNENPLLSAQSGNIFMNNTAVSTNYSEGGGNILISGGKITMVNSSLDATTIEQSGGKLEVYADEFTLDNSWIDSGTYGTGQGGLIDIKSRGNINLLNHSRLDNNTFKTENGGQAGELRLEAAQLNLSNSAIGSNSYGSGHGGNIYLKVTDLTLSEASEISTDSRGSGINAGSAGEIAIEAAHILSRGLISSDTFNSGSAGLLSIKAQQLFLENGALILSATYGTGQGGIIDLHISDKLVLRGRNNQSIASSISASTVNNELEKAGDAGYIIIHAGQVSLEDSAQIGSNTFGSGQGGNLLITVSGTLTISGYDGKSVTSGIFASSENQTLKYAGHAGNIYIEAGQINLLDGGHIDSATLGAGQGGNIELHTNDLNIKGFHSGIYANSFGTQAGAGNAGVLMIQAKNLTLSDGGKISTQTEQAGGGDIVIAAEHLLYLPQGHITTSVKGGIGNGGNIGVKYPKFIILNQGDIRAQADEGQGGNIYLSAQQFVYSIESVISASSNKGLDGEIWIDSPENTLGSDLLALPAIIPVEVGLKTPCSALTDENMSSFAVAMNHGIPNLPDDLQFSVALEPIQRATQNPAQAIQKITVPTFKLSCRYSDKTFYENTRI